MGVGPVSVPPDSAYLLSTTLVHPLGGRRESTEVRRGGATLLSPIPPNGWTLPPNLRTEAGSGVVWSVNETVESKGTFSPSLRNFYQLFRRTPLLFCLNPFRDLSTSEPTLRVETARNRHVRPRSGNKEGLGVKRVDSLPSVTCSGPQGLLCMFRGLDPSALSKFPQSQL